MVIQFTGKYPTLCFGILTVTHNGKQYKFPEGAMVSGGCVWFDEDWNAYIDDGPWAIVAWPDDFPEDLKEKVLAKVNAEIPWGCCGGCI